MNVRCIPLYSSCLTESPVIAYLCKLKPRPGALNLEKCVAAGVQPGPLLGLLKNGIDVTLENGTKVLSKDVSEPSETGLGFFFLDIPSENYLKSLQEQTQILKDTQQQEETSIAVVLHFTAPSMLQNNCYQEFITQHFAKHTQHIYLNSRDNNFSGYVSAHRIQWQLNQLHPGMFPLLAEGVELTNTLSISGRLKKTKLEEKISNLDTNDSIEVKSNKPDGLNTLSCYHLRPRKGLYTKVLYRKFI